MSQAQRMVKKCSDTTGSQLNLVHAFFISILALRYRTSIGEKVMWPNQYTWLLKNDLIRWDDPALWGLSEEHISGKNNADTTTKLLALGQVCWFVAQSIMRSVHNLPLSQLEIMTLSYIPLVALTYFYWWLKPKDIMVPAVVELPQVSQEQRTSFESMSVSSIFNSEGLGQQDSFWTIWYLTPRVFEKEAEDKELQEARDQAEQKASREAERKLEAGKAISQEKQISKMVDEEKSTCQPGTHESSAKEIVLGY